MCVGWVRGGGGCTGIVQNQPIITWTCQCSAHFTFILYTHTSFEDCKPMGLKKDIAQSDGLSSNLCLER